MPGSLAQKMKLKPGMRAAVLNATWSAFSLRPYKAGEAKQSFR